MSLSLAAPIAPTISQPNFTDLREPLLGLWQRNLPDASARRCDWLYGQGRAQAWLLQAAGAPAVGAAGLMLRRMYVGGELVEGGGAIDLNVDQTQRSVGPALSLVRAVVATADQAGRELLYGMPNPAATAVMKRAGYQLLGEFSSWTRVLDVTPQLATRLKVRAAVPVIARAANAALRVRDACRPGLMARLRIETPREFDVRFDRLSARVACQVDVVGQRSADFLNWRFSACPDLQYQIFALVNQSDLGLAGYLVWYRDDDGVSIADLLAEDSETTLRLLNVFAGCQRRAGSLAIRFNCFAPPEFYSTLKQAGFHQRTNRHPVLYRARGTQAVPTGQRWYLTMADSDTDV